MLNFALKRKCFLLWGTILLLAGGLFHQATTSSAPESAPCATAAMQQRTAAPRPTATVRLTATPKPTATVPPTAAPALAAAFNSSAESYRVKISYSAQCGNYNHVGNSWTKVFYINDEQVHGSKTLTLHPGEGVKLEVVITEDDTYPDIGHDTRTLSLTEEELKQSIKISTTVEVYENRGRYSGNAAVWTVVYTITPVK